MKNIIFLCFVFGMSSAIWTSSSHAGLLLEPYLGFEYTKNNINYAGQDLPSFATANNYGMRLGYKLPALFWVALDGSLGSGKIKFDDVNQNDYQMTRNVLGVTAGIDLPIFLRVWLGQGVNDRLEIKRDAITDKLKGTHTKIGLGFTMIPFVSLNLEYINRHYSEATGSSFTGSTPFSSVYPKFDQASYYFSVSVPFDL